MNGVYKIPKPFNEPIYKYESGSKERDLLNIELNKIRNEYVKVPLIIGGKEIHTEEKGKIIVPHDHKHELGEFSMATEEHVKLAVEESQKAKSAWENMPYYDRAAIFLRAAELITHKYRYILNAATMLNQSKTYFQAEIDAACELADFFRFNAKFLEEIYMEQPQVNSPGIWNRSEYRPLEGFVFAITPFNFTSIAGNLPTAPAIMGNTVLWKPASTSVLSGYYIMKLLKEAGVPDGVINFLPGSGRKVGDPVFESSHLAGIHFTGSTGVFNSMWKKISENIDKYKIYPRIVGETGGKDFIFVHNSADTTELSVAAVRGAFEYQGQKCSAASRMYVPSSMIEELKTKMVDILKDARVGDIEDYDVFMGAVIDESSFKNTVSYINAAKESKDSEIVFGGKSSKETGYFIDPTIIVTKDPHFISMEEEIFAPVLTIFVYDDEKFEETLKICDSTSNYALTGAIFSYDRAAVNTAFSILKNAAGNFYINDKPTGAVVGQQPFGGARKSGTNDKAGSKLNLLRWTSPRTIKENFLPPSEFKLL